MTEAPRTVQRRPRTERRVVFALDNTGRCESRTEELVAVQEVWLVGTCTHFVLDVQTRRRIEEACPDCMVMPPALDEAAKKSAMESMVEAFQMGAVSAKVAEEALLKLGAVMGSIKVKGLFDDTAPPPKPKPKSPIILTGSKKQYPDKIGPIEFKEPEPVVVGKGVTPTIKVNQMIDGKMVTSVIAPEDFNPVTQVLVKPPPKAKLTASQWLTAQLGKPDYVACPVCGEAALLVGYEQFYSNSFGVVQIKAKFKHAAAKFAAWASTAWTEHEVVWLSKE